MTFSGPNVGSAWYEIDARIDKLRSRLGESDRMITQTGTKAERTFGSRVTSSIGRMGGALTTVVKTAGIVGVAGVAGLGFLGGMAIKSAADMESMQVAWETLLGSTEAAKDRMAELKEFAATTPFEIPEVMQASRQLQVFGGTTLATGDNLRMVGDIAAGTQQPFTDVAMWIGRTYDAMKSGQPFGEAAMRLQEMGALSGDGRRKLEELAAGVKDGSITMNQAWKGTGNVFGQFSGLMEKQSQTTAGQWSNLMDNLGQTLVGIGEIMLPFVKTLIGGMNDALPAIRETLINVFQTAGPIIGNVIGGIAGVLGNIVGWITQNWPTISSIIGGVMERIGAVIQAVAPIIGAVFNYISTNVLPALLQAFNAVSGWVSAHWPQISSIIQKAGQIIVGVITALWPIIEQTAKAVLPILGAAFEAVMPFIDGLLTVISGFLDFLTKQLIPIVVNVARGVSNAFLALHDFFAAIWNGMLHILGQVVGSMIGIIKNVVGIAADIPGPWQEGAKKQRAALEDMEADVKSWGTQTTNTMDTTFEDQLEIARHGGTNTAQAYADAIFAEGDYLHTRAAQFAHNAAAVLAASSPPGPESPLHDIERWGERTAEAYADGWDNRAKYLSASIRGTLTGVRAVASPTTAVAAPAALPAPAPLRGGGFTLVVNWQTLVKPSPAEAQSVFDAIGADFFRRARAKGAI